MVIFQVRLTLGQVIANDFEAVVVTGIGKLTKADRVRTGGSAGVIIRFSIILKVAPSAGLTNLLLSSLTLGDGDLTGVIKTVGSKSLRCSVLYL